MTKYPNSLYSSQKEKILSSPAPNRVEEDGEDEDYDDLEGLEDEEDAESDPPLLEEQAARTGRAVASPAKVSADLRL